VTPSGDVSDSNSAGDWVRGRRSVGSRRGPFTAPCSAVSHIERRPCIGRAHTDDYPKRCRALSMSLPCWPWPVGGVGVFTLMRGAVRCGAVPYDAMLIKAAGHDRRLIGGRQTRACDGQQRIPIGASACPGQRECVVRLRGHVRCAADCIIAPKSPRPACVSALFSPSKNVRALKCMSSARASRE
jgi:hypothetical protein